MLNLEQAEAWGKWLAHYYPRLADNEANGTVLAQHVQEFHKGVWSEFAVRDAIFVNKRILTWLPEDIRVEDPRDMLARQRAEAAKKVADAEAVKAAAEAARVKAERKQQQADEEWKRTHANLLGTSRHNAQSEHTERENQKIDDAKQTVEAINQMMAASLKQEIAKIISEYRVIDPVHQRVNHGKTQKFQEELRSIKVVNNGTGQPDYARQLALVRAAIKRLP